MRDWEVTDVDRGLFERELAPFVPPRVFDAHAHWYATEHFPRESVPSICASGPPRVGAEAYRSSLDALLPGRTGGGLFFPFPHPGVDVDGANAFLAAELDKLPGARGQMLIVPQHTTQQIDATVRAHGFVGLKCYHVFAAQRPTFEATIEDFFPEAQAAVAHELGLAVTLHMVRARALADPLNQATIRRYARRYPNLRLILAHAARGFNPHHTIEGIESLAGLENVWFDTSAVTDAGAIEAIIQTMGHQRVLYGSDFPVSHVRGRCVALGDSFFWISAENTRLDVPYARLELSLVGLEALRTLKVAARSLRLGDDQVEDIFYNNAAALFGR